MSQISLPMSQILRNQVSDFPKSCALVCTIGENAIVDDKCDELLNNNKLVILGVHINETCYKTGCVRTRDFTLHTSREKVSVGYYCGQLHSLLQKEERRSFTHSLLWQCSSPFFHAGVNKQRSFV